MGFMHHITACNNHDPSGYIPFLIDNRIVGKVRPEFAETLNRWPHIFQVTSASLKLVVESSDLMKRSAEVASILQKLVTEKVICQMLGELYAAVDENRNNPLLLLDRAIAPYFGIRAYGQHLNGFVRTAEGMKLWIAQRAKDRINYPGCLDNFVAGGLPHGIGMMDNMIKECLEEAAVPEKLSSQVIPVGSVQYNADSAKGFNPFKLFCYDLELPASFQPRCTDGEVECFYLWPVEKVMEIVQNTNDFKLNCNLVIIDFLIRHRYIGTEDDGYYDLKNNLKPNIAL